MAWYREKIGAAALIEPLNGAERRLRAAIPELSRPIPERRVYTHTGWICRDRANLYLHGGGGIGSAGLIDDIEVELPRELAPFRLPAPPEGAALHTALTAAIELFHIAPARIMGPMIGATYRSVLGGADFSVGLIGPTGGFKTALAALVQSHFGQFGERCLPGSWASTVNFLREQAFVTKDAIFVVDDYVPEGTRVDRSRQARTAAEFLRDVGNATGRGRLDSYASMRPVKMPRGMPLVTGEDNFFGESLRGRTFIPEVTRGEKNARGKIITPGDVDLKKLTIAQRNADAGLYAQANSAYIKWLASRLDEIRAEMKSTVLDLRTKAEQGGHTRTPGIVGNLYFGALSFFRFAVEVEALPQSLADEFLGRIWAGLLEAARVQGANMHEAEPTRRFMALFRSAISSGGAHLINRDSSRPAGAASYGWRQSDIGQWAPQGARGGWIDGDDLYLDIDVALRAANAIVSDGSGITISVSALRKRLCDKGLLVSRGKETIEILKTVEGVRRKLLHLKLATVLPTQDAELEDDESIDGSND